MGYRYCMAKIHHAQVVCYCLAISGPRDNAAEASTVLRVMGQLGEKKSS